MIKFLADSWMWWLRYLGDGFLAFLDHRAKK